MRTFNTMPTLRKQSLERYLRSRFGPTATLLTYGGIGKESSQGAYKQYGYGSPVKLTFQVGRTVQSAVLETMSPGPFGHEHPADRAQAILWDSDSYGRLPRHVKALDVGAFTDDRQLGSVAQTREYFVLTQWMEGASYHVDRERLAKGGRLRKQDKERTVALAHYLAEIHARKRRDPALYRRRLRELIGHGECIMGLTDSYPDRYEFISADLLRGRRSLQPVALAPARGDPASVASPWRFSSLECLVPERDLSKGPAGRISYCSGATVSLRSADQPGSPNRHHHSLGDAARQICDLVKAKFL